MTLSAQPQSIRLGTPGDWEARAAFMAALPDAAAGFSGTHRHVSRDLCEVRLPGHVPFRYHGPRRPNLWHRLTKPPLTVDGVYEPATSFVLSRIVAFERPALAFDLGSTGGYFAMLMASRADARTDVLGLDMMPFVVPAFETDRRENPALADRMIEGRQVALSDQDAGDKTVWMHKSRLFEHEPRPEEYRERFRRRIKHALNGEHWKLRLNKLTIPVRSIDSICAELGRDPDVLKIDVDGYEAKVLPGAMELLRRRRPWIVLELHRQVYLDRFGVGRADILRPLLEIGYRAMLVRGRGALTAIEWRPVDLAQPGSLETGDTDLVILY